MGEARRKQLVAKSTSHPGHHLSLHQLVEAAFDPQGWLSQGRTSEPYIIDHPQMGKIGVMGRMSDFRAMKDFPGLVGLPRDGCRRRRWLGHQRWDLGARPIALSFRIADIGAILWS